jgi:hypothetical protein
MTALNDDSFHRGLDLIILGIETFLGEHAGST